MIFLNKVLRLIIYVMTYLRQQYKRKKSFPEEYDHKRRLSLVDFTDRVPEKRMRKERLPSGLYGYTSLGLDYMVINDNLSFDQDYKTQVHEAIHTENEYETRVLTEWMLEGLQEETFGVGKIPNLLYSNESKSLNKRSSKKDYGKKGDMDWQRAFFERAQTKEAE